MRRTIISILGCSKETSVTLDLREVYISKEITYISFLFQSYNSCGQITNVGAVSRGTYGRP